MGATTRVHSVEGIASTRHRHTSYRSLLDDLPGRVGKARKHIHNLWSMCLCKFIAGGT
jgi:hypothetical protein